MPDATDILKADAEGRYFDALGLDSDVAVEAVREREVVLCHRYRAQPDVVAAVHHAAEQAVDLLRTAISIPAVVDRLLLKWRPAWGVPSEDLSAFLRAQLNLERMVSDILGTIRQHGLVTEQEVLNICLMVLAGQEGQLKHEMAMWYVSRAAGIRNRAVADFNAASQGASLARAATLAGSLKTSLRAALACAERARMLEPGHQEVLGAVSKLHDDVAQADGVLASSREMVWALVGDSTISRAFFSGMTASRILVSDWLSTQRPPAESTLSPIRVRAVTGNCLCNSSIRSTNDNAGG